ncbi:MAG: aminoacetone oxidase family FAD-binding enzyme [Bacilli bacterium]|jgi:predicted Rossmann fold flavoprotein
MKNIAIIGGGAAGLTCAILLGKRLGSSASITVFEQSNRVGRKVLATGNGRGNLSNHDVSTSHYNNPEFVQSVLHVYPATQVSSFWRLFGLEVITDEAGRMYPFSQSSHSILDVLLLGLHEASVRVQTDCEIQEIKPNCTGYELFSLSGSEGVFHCVVLTTGSMASYPERSSPKLVSSLENLGFECTDLFPALGPLGSTHPQLGALNGTRVSARASLIVNGKQIRVEDGEVLFKKNALSGIAVFQLSNAYAREQKRSEVISAWIELDLCPNFSLEQVYGLLIERRKAFPNRILSQLFSGWFLRVVGQALILEAKLESTNQTLSSLSEETLFSFAKVIKAWRFPIDQGTSQLQAQVMVGGLQVHHFDPVSFEAKHLPHFYACGEALDIDGDSGGFNLHFAFSSGAAVADAISLSLDKEETSL